MKKILTVCFIIYFMLLACSQDCVPGHSLNASGDCVPDDTTAIDTVVWYGTKYELLGDGSLRYKSSLNKHDDWLKAELDSVTRKLMKQYPQVDWSKPPIDIIKQIQEIDKRKSI